MVELNGVVVIMFCLHQWAGQVCWFDTGWCNSFWGHPHLAVYARALADLKHRPKLKNSV